MKTEGGEKQGAREEESQGSVREEEEGRGGSKRGEGWMVCVRACAWINGCWVGWLEG